MFSLFKLSAQILVQVALSLQLYAFLLAVLPNSTAADPIFFRSNTYQMTFKTSFFNSNANFSPEGGTFEQLGNDKYFKTLNLGLLWDLVLSKRTAWRLGLTGAWAESSDGSFIRKNSALTELLLGYQYFLFAKPIKAKPEVAVIYPIKKVEKGTDEVTLSEGVVVVKLGVWLQKKWLSLYNYGYFGYAYRSDGRSSLAECTLGIKKKFKGIGLGAEISGFQSVTEDEYTNSPTQRLAITDAVNGGSRKFHSSRKGTP